MKNKIEILITGLVICFCFVSLVNAEPICGDGTCVGRADGTGENCESCPQDCSCPSGFVCDPSDPNADLKGCVGSVCEGCIETFYIEDDTLPANGTITKIWFKFICPGDVWFDILLDDEECPDVKKCGGFIRIPGSEFDEDVVNYAYYKAPLLEPTKELSGTMTLFLRFAHVQSGDYKVIPVTIDIGEYVAPEPKPKKVGVFGPAKVVYPDGTTVTVEKGKTKDVDFEADMIVEPLDLKSKPIIIWPPNNILWGVAKYKFKADGLVIGPVGDNVVTTIDLLPPDGSEVSKMLYTITVDFYGPQTIEIGGESPQIEYILTSKDRPARAVRWIAQEGVKKVVIYAAKTNVYTYLPAHLYEAFDYLPDCLTISTEVMKFVDEYNQKYKTKPLPSLDPDIKSPQIKGHLGETIYLESEGLIEITDKGTSVHVFDGTFELSDPDGVKTVLIKSGQSSTYEKGGVPTDPEPFDPNSIDRWWKPEAKFQVDVCDFNDGPAQNWIEDGSRCWSISDGVYAMTGNKKGDANRYSHYDQELCDFTYQVDVRKIAGDSNDRLRAYGLWIRSDGTENNHYMFAIVVDGRYMIAKRVGGEFTGMIDMTPSDALKTGYNEWNTLKVVAQDSTLQFYANGVLLETKKDTSLSCGRVGLFAVDSVDSDSSDTVQFDNVLIVKTAESIPTLPGDITRIYEPIPIPDKKPIYVDDDFTDDPANHKWNTIQEGITDANDGDTVLVYTGTYYETVVLNKSLTLVGEGLPTIDASGTGNAITITADNCIVKGFRCVNAYSYQYAGIRVESNNNVIEDNTCKNNDIGIVLVTASDNIIAHNTATNNEKNGIYLEDSNNNRITDNDASNNDLNGISLDTSNNNEIRDNNANYNHYQGIRLRTSNENIIANNAAENNDEYGIALWTSDANVVANNMAKDNGEIGILLSASHHNRITENDASNTVNYDGISLLDSSSNNEIANNTANSNNFNGIRLYSHSNNNILTNNIANSNREAGILCWTSSGNILTYNKLNSNNYGFWLYNYSTDNILANNTATTNSCGIYVVLSSNNNIYLNNFVDNTDNAYSYNSNNIWRSASKLSYTYNSKSYWHYLGNYWSDYSGSDTDGDGIGDSYYSIDGDEDEHPLMKLWENYFAP